MDLEIKPTGEPEQEEHKKIRTAQRKDPTLTLVAKTLICILVIDTTIWGYFHFIKHVPLVKGLHDLITSIQNTLQGEPVRQTIHRRIIINQVPQQYNYRPQQYQSRTTTDDEIHDIEIKKDYIGNGKDNIYSWRDERGTIHYSNIGFPEGENIEKLWVRKLPQ